MCVCDSACTLPIGPPQSIKFGHAPAYGLAQMPCVRKPTLVVEGGWRENNLYNIKAGTACMGQL